MQRLFIIILVLLLPSFGIKAQNTYFDQAAEYFERGDFEKALELGNIALEEFEKTSVKNYEDYFISLSLIARCYSELENYSEAIKWYSEALNICENIYGKYNKYHLTILSFLEQNYSKLGNFQEAINFCTQALKISEELLDQFHPDYVNLLYNLAGYNSNLGNYQEAIRIGTEALGIQEKVSGKNNSEYATSLANIAHYNYLLGNYQEAIRLGTEALKIREVDLGNRDSKYAKLLYAKSLNNLAGYNCELGNYQEAIRLGTEALKMREEVLGKNDPDYATTLNNLAIFNSVLGNYQVAIRLGIEALKIREKVPGKNHPDYANSLNNLAHFYAELGNFQEAIRLGTEALKIYEVTVEKNNPDYVMSLNYLASYNSDAGNLQEAIRFGIEALKLAEEVLDRHHPNYATFLNHVAAFNSDLGNSSEAIKLETEVLKIREEVLGKNHPDYATSLGNLARYYSDIGNYQEAIRLATQALKIREERLGKKHPDYAISVQNILSNYYLSNNFEKLKESVTEAYELTTTILSSNFSFLTESERENYWNSGKVFYSWLIPAIAHKFDARETTELGFNASLLSKGILLNSEIEFDKFLVETGKPELAEKYNEIRSLRLQLNKLYEKPVAERWCDTDSLERVANNLERELMYESKEFGDYTRNLSITWQDVQKGLKQKDVAVEFVSFPLNQDSTMYMAYVLKPEMESPQMVKLFEEKDLASLSSSENPAEIYNKVEASNLIWRKLEPFLEGFENVYFAPDGILHQTAIEYLPDLNGEGMMADRYNLHRLSSTRQLAVSQDRNESTSAAVYGGIVYDTDVDSMKEESRKYIQEKEEGVFLAQRGFNPFINYADILNTRLGVRYLDGTRIEAEEVNQSLLANNYQTQLVVGTRATEESFKNLSGKGNGIIHIATHGFYWQEDEADRMARSNERLMFMSKLNDNGPRYVEDKALTRSGLFMSGVNNILRGDTIPEGVEDGILTAQEIAQMNLRGTDLVVLSACQTGLGEISGDGVFGLQRGFKKAGANSLLMSLWKVDDDATQKLMEAFYRNLMAGQSKQQSLRNAQKALLDDGFDDPKFWAAFILLDGLN